MSAQAGPDITEQDAADIATNLFGLWKAGGTLAQAKGITDDECEAMYAYGHSLYAQGKYNDAFKIFAQLVAYNHMESRYQMALASAMQMTKRHEEALNHYMIVTVMRIDDPVPVYHCAECLLALGKLAEAAETLELVGTMCRAGEHDALKARAATVLKALKDKTK
jgi:type III secretion system low calcium response chaperone LcrH/SycD